ncbi:MAG: DUF2997 domain-containing protein [Thermoflexales bacterium]|nr:DUF2997 domain-containing protein [Thermoflexales bacterium]
MAQKHEIEISISPEGQVEYTIKGIKGRHCADIAELLKILGQVEHEENTREYYEQAQEAGVYVQH